VPAAPPAAAPPVPVVVPAAPPVPVVAPAAPPLPVVTPPFALPPVPVMLPPVPPWPVLLPPLPPPSSFPAVVESFEQAKTSNPQHANRTKPFSIPMGRNVPSQAAFHKIGGPSRNPVPSAAQPRGAWSEDVSRGHPSRFRGVSKKSEESGEGSAAMYWAVRRSHRDDGVRCDQALAARVFAYAFWNR
jgi:hypothetical protein